MSNWVCNNTVHAAMFERVEITAEMAGSSQLPLLAPTAEILLSKAMVIHAVICQPAYFAAAFRRRFKPCRSTGQH